MRSDLCQVATNHWRLKGITLIILLEYNILLGNSGSWHSCGCNLKQTIHPNNLTDHLPWQQHTQITLVSQQDHTCWHTETTEERSEEPQPQIQIWLSYMGYVGTMRGSNTVKINVWEGFIYGSEKTHMNTTARTMHCRHDQWWSICGFYMVAESCLIRREDVTVTIKCFIILFPQVWSAAEPHHNGKELRLQALYPWRHQGEGLVRVKRDWIIPQIRVLENSKQVPEDLVQVNMPNLATDSILH